MSPRHAVPAAALTGLLLVCGCDQIDPLKRDYIWKPADINRHNIATMAVNPNDLIRGRHDTRRRRAVNEADAVERIWSGKPMPLSTPGTGGAGATATGTGGTGAGATGGGT